MGLPIVWSALARQQLLEIMTYIAAQDALSAERLGQRFESATRPLSEYPELCRPGRVPGTRELVVHANYIIVYRILADTIEIANVLHTRRQYP